VIQETMSCRLVLIFSMRYCASGRNYESGGVDVIIFHTPSFMI